MCPPMIVWPNAICFHFVRKNINKQYITQNVFLTMSLDLLITWSQVIYLNYVSWIWENCKTRRTLRAIVMKVYIDQKVQDEIILLSVTRINDSWIIIYPKIIFELPCWGHFVFVRGTGMHLLQSLWPPSDHKWNCGKLSVAWEPA